MLLIGANISIVKHKLKNIFGPSIECGELNPWYELIKFVASYSIIK